MTWAEWLTAGASLFALLYGLAWIRKNAAHRYRVMQARRRTKLAAKAQKEADAKRMEEDLARIRGEQ